MANQEHMGDFGEEPEVDDVVYRLSNLAMGGGRGEHYNQEDSNLMAGLQPSNQELEIDAYARR